jgi:hypothetical protein
MKPIPADDTFFQSLRQFDYELFLRVKAKGCSHCKGILDISHIPRKPRGLGEHEETRFSLCCRNEGCRRRHTPPSLRFFGRRVYPAFVFILALDFYVQLGLRCQISRQTLARWRAFWKNFLLETGAFMKWARGFLQPGWAVGSSPASVVEAFGFPKPHSWVTILKFFSQEI